MRALVVYNSNPAAVAPDFNLRQHGGILLFRLVLLGVFLGSRRWLLGRGGERGLRVGGFGRLRVGLGALLGILDEPGPNRVA